MKRLIIITLFFIGCTVDRNPIIQKQKDISTISFVDDIYAAEILFVDYDSLNNELAVKIRGNVDLTIGIYLSVNDLLMREIVDYSGNDNEIKFTTFLEAAPDEIIVYWHHEYVG